MSNQPKPDVVIRGSITEKWFRARTVGIFDSGQGHIAVVIDGELHSSPALPVDEVTEQVVNMLDAVGNKDVVIAPFVDTGPSSLPDDYDPPPMHERVSRDLWAWNQREYFEVRPDLRKEGGLR